MNDAFSRAFLESFGRALKAAAKIPPLPPLTEEQKREGERKRQQREIERNARFARSRRHRIDKGVAKQLGVTEAGLVWLAKLVANPAKATTRGNEARPLIDKGFVVWAGADYGYQITDAGRNIVRRARQMGW